MVVRHDAAGALVVGQAAHARMCGQFARAWGNARVEAPDPLEEVALGAEQHDLGWAALDATPELDPATGLPRSFLQIDPATSAELWRHGPERLVSQSRYAALLATMHGRRLTELRPLERLAPAAATGVRALREESTRREAWLTAALQADPATAPVASPERIARNSALVWAWDGLSLALLLDWAPRTFDGVPAAGGGVLALELRAAAGAAGTFSLSPWPFAASEPLHVRTEGRRLSGGAATVEELHAALARAPWETVTFTLAPAAS